MDFWMRIYFSTRALLVFINATHWNKPVDTIAKTTCYWTKCIQILEYFDLTEDHQRLAHLEMNSHKSNVFLLRTFVKTSVPFGTLSSHHRNVSFTSFVSRSFRLTHNLIRRSIVKCSDFLSQTPLVSNQNLNMADEVLQHRIVNL